MKIIVHLLLSALAIFVAAFILPGVHIASWLTLLVVAIVLGVINAVIKPILVLITMPINLITLGLFVLVINALLIMLTAVIVPGFKVDNFWWALLMGLVLSIIHGVLHALEF